jgi:hypothetical protein
VDTDSSDWPREPWFPIFWKELADRAAPQDSARKIGYHRTGLALSFPVRAGEEIALTGPGGERVVASIRGRAAVFVPEDVGLFRARNRAGDPDRVLAVNLLSPAETDLRGRSGSEGALPEAFTKPSGPSPVSLAEEAAAVALLLLLGILFAEVRKRTSSVRFVNSQPNT